MTRSRRMPFAPAVPMTTADVEEIRVPARGRSRGSPSARRPTWMRSTR
jgi:hypothetical protein